MIFLLLKNYKREEIIWQKKLHKNRPEKVLFLSFLIFWSEVIVKKQRKWQKLKWKSLSRLQQSGEKPWNRVLRYRKWVISQKTQKVHALEKFSSSNVYATTCSDHCIIYDKTYLSTITFSAVTNVCSRPYLQGSVLKRKLLRQRGYRASFRPKHDFVNRNKNQC